MLNPITNPFFKKALFFFILTCFAFHLKAQKSFSRDSAKFIKEYKSYVSNANTDESNKDLKLFEEYWETAKFSKAQEASIMQLANSMLLNEMKPIPYFVNLTKCFNAHVTSGLDLIILDDFITISNKNLEKNRLGFLSFMQTCYPLFTDNILFGNDQRRWFVRDNNFKLVTEGDFAIEFERSDLICKAPVDSLILIGTKGTYYPNKSIWKGDKGKITWQRHNNEAQFVVFGAYEISLSGGEIEIANVDYTNTDFFAGKVKGIFKEKVSNTTDSALVTRSPYPQFSTYESDVEIKNLIGDEAKYFGGIAVEGKEISSQTFGNSPARIELFYKGKPKVIAKSTAFKITDRSVQSQGAEITVLLDSGEILHPKAIFNYNFDKKVMIVSRGKTGLTRANFQDNLHNLEIEVDNIAWKQEESFLDFDNLSNDEPAIIESRDYYKQFKYDKIQGMLSVNPIELVIRFAIKNRKNEFYLPDYAKERRNTRDNLVQQMYDLADGGFIKFNPANDSIYVLPKMFNYYYADKKVKDYDVIRFSSVIAERSNAQLNLLNNELTIQGVRRFNFSDSQNVIAVPTEQTVIVKNDRTLYFGGMIRAGKFDLFGQDFIFDYERFATRPSTVDSLRLYSPDSNNQMKRVNSVLTNLFGTLEIDKPNNKSGLKDFPQYPIFTTIRGSEIHYDKPGTHNGAYKSESFKFIVDPFSIDSMDNFTVSGLKFEGTFESADIFPDFRYRVSIQEDFSLGFKHTIPNGGYSMYKGKGLGEMDISLSNEGLYGKGKITYNNTFIESESFLLLPDKTVAKANKFTVPESGIYPAVAGANLGTTWTPYDNKMSLATSSEDATIKVFKMGYDFKGEMKVTPGALKADGVLAWDEAEFSSKNMVYKKNGVTADSGAIKIFAADPSKIAFNSSNLKSNIDFDKREGKFTANNVNDLTYLPYNNYGANMNDYKWNMNDKTIDINIGNMKGAKPRFVSTRADQDSLAFEAKHALFNIKTGDLAIDGIPYIDVADSRVFLEDGKAMIRENAEMDTLFNSKMDVNRDAKFHQFFSCKTKILGKTDLKASGLFNYENRNGKQVVFFDSIYGYFNMIQADAFIKGGDSFMLDKNIAYYGRMRVQGNSKSNHLFGYVRPITGFDSFPGKGVRFRDSIDRNNVVLRIGVPKDEDNRTLFIGTYASTKGGGYYPSFYGLRQNYSDDEVTSDTGILYFDYTTNQLVMGSEEKLLDGNPRGNIMRVSPEKGLLEAEGRMAFGFEYKSVDIKSGGKASFQKEDSTYTFDILNLMKMPLPKELVDQMVKMANAAKGKPALSNTEFVINAFASTFDNNKDATNALAKLEKNNKFETGKDADGLLAYTVSGLRYVPQQRALFSKNDIEIYQIGDNTINASFSCLYELEKKRSGDAFSIYIEFTKNDWVYLNFVRGILYVVTSDGEFNNTIPIFAEKTMTDDFSVRLASARTVDRFQDRYADQ